MTKKERIKKLLSFGFSYKTIASNSHLWNDGKSLSVKEIEKLADYSKPINKSVHKYVPRQKYIDSETPENVDNLLFIVECRNKGKTPKEISEISEIDYRTVVSLCIHQTILMED